MSPDNLDVLGDCVVSLNACNYSLLNSIKSLDRVLEPHEDTTELKRLAKIIEVKKIYKIYPITYINERISEYNDIKNNRILSSIETLEKLNELKAKEKDNQMSYVELLQNRLEQFVSHKKRESLVPEKRKLDDETEGFDEEEKAELEKLQEEIDLYRFQLSKLQLKKKARKSMGV